MVFMETTTETTHFMDVDDSRYIRIYPTPLSPGWWDIEVVEMWGDREVGSGKGLNEARAMAREWIAANL